MAKDVKYKGDTWSKMSRAIGNVAGSKPSPYNVESPNRSGQAISTYAKSFSEYVEELVSISKEAKECINENDSDRVVHFTHHDDVKSAKYVQDGMDELETYAKSVDVCVYREIDRPFTEKMDKFIEEMQGLNIDNYEVKNIVGYKKTTILNHGGKKYRISTEPEKIKLKDLYKVDNPYKAILNFEYDAYKKTDEHKKNKISKEEYLQYVTHTKAFKYESLNDKKYSLINKIIFIGTVVVNVVCPPAGLVLDVTLASLEVSSSVTGKDWLTGEKLSAEERMLRVGFAALSFIPGIKGIKGIAKGETSLKSIVKFRKIEDFKHMASSVQQRGKNILNRLANYGNKKLISGLEKLSSELRKVDDLAGGFRLNLGLEPQLVDGVMPRGTSNIDDVIDRIDAFVGVKKIQIHNTEKLLEVDKINKNIQKAISKKPITSKSFNNREVMKKEYYGHFTELLTKDRPKYSPDIKKWFNEGGSIIIEDYGKIEGMDRPLQVWKYTSKEGVTVSYIPRKMPVEGGYEVVKVIEFPESVMYECNRKLSTIDIGEFSGDREIDRKIAKELFRKKGVKSFKGYAIHHDYINGRLQLIDEDIHERFAHRGGHYYYKYK